MDEVTMYRALAVVGTLVGTFLLFFVIRLFIAGARRTAKAVPRSVEEAARTIGTVSAKAESKAKETYQAFKDARRAEQAKSVRDTD